MKPVSLGLSILLTAKVAVAVPPPGCDDVCGQAQKWDDCVANYSQLTKGVILNPPAASANGFCEGQGLANTGVACKLCQNNGYGTGPNHRPGGPPALLRRHIDDCATLCGGPDNQANWQPGCDKICANRPSGPRNIPNPPMPLVRRQRRPPINDDCAELCGGPGNSANWPEGCDKICAKPHGPHGIPSPAAAASFGRPPVSAPPAVAIPDLCALMCKGIPKDQWNAENNCAEICAYHPKMGTPRALLGAPPAVAIPDLCALMCKGIPKDHWNAENNCAEICAYHPKMGTPRALLARTVELTGPPAMRVKTLSLAEFQKECAVLTCPGDGENGGPGTGGRRAPPAMQGTLFYAHCNACRAASECLSVDAAALAPSNGCNRRFQWLTSTECGTTNCAAGEQCVVTKCKSGWVCDPQYTASPVCVNLDTVKKCNNMNACGGDKWTCQVHAQFQNGTDVGLGMWGELQPRGFCSLN